MGYDGLELACWGDHFGVDKAAVSKKKYCQERWEILSDHGLTAFAISSHLVGQAVCDLIDERHQAILPPDAVRANPKKCENGQRENWRKPPKPVATSSTRNPAEEKKDDFPAVVNGFTGSSIWHSIYAFPPTDQAYWDKGFQDFAKRFGPIFEEFEKQKVNFALEVHPTEIAFDIARRRPCRGQGTQTLWFQL